MSVCAVMILMDNLELFCGNDLVIDTFHIKHPTAREIIDFGIDKYMAGITLFTVIPSQLMSELHKSGIDFEFITQYDLFNILFASEDYKDFMEFLTGYSDFELYIDTSNGDRFVASQSADVVINSDLFYTISDFLLLINNIEKPKPITPASELMKEMFIKQDKNKKEAEAKKSKNTKNNSQLLNIISSLIIGSNGSVTFFNVWDLPIYSLHYLIKRVHKVKFHDSISTLRYAGLIDTSKLKDDEIAWDGNLD